MRTFVALDIDDAIRERLALFMDGVRGFAPDARWVKPQSIHVTLKFIGENPPEVVRRIQQELAAVHMPAFEIAFQGYGFFPTPKRARVFWIGIQSGPQISALAKAVDEATHAMGIPGEQHPFSPHLTLARGGGGSGMPRQSKTDRPNSQFRRLQETLCALPAPEFGTTIAREFFLYESQL